jgi:hypothetical protein
VDAVLGPGRRGVIRLSDVPREELQHPLAEAGLPSATPVELGVGVPGPDAPGPAAPGPGDRQGLAGYVAVACRRPSLVLDRDTWIVAAADGHMARGGDPAALALAACDRPPPRRVAVFGGAWIREEEPVYGSIRSLGRWLAEGGCMWCVAATRGPWPRRAGA